LERAGAYPRYWQLVARKYRRVELRFQGRRICNSRSPLNGGVEQFQSFRREIDEGVVVEEEADALFRRLERGSGRRIGLHVRSLRENEYDRGVTDGWVRQPGNDDRVGVGIGVTDALGGVQNGKRSGRKARSQWVGRVCDLDLGLTRNRDAGGWGGQEVVLQRRFPVKDWNRHVPELRVDVAGADGGRDDDQGLAVGITGLGGGIADSNYFKSQNGFQPRLGGRVTRV